MSRKGWKIKLMEQIENPMVMPQVEYNTDFEERNRYLAEKADLFYEDKVTEKLLKEDM